MARTSWKEVHRWHEMAEKYGATVTISRPDRNYLLSMDTPVGYGVIGYYGPLHGVVSVLKAYVYGVETGLRRLERGYRR